MGPLLWLFDFFDEESIRGRFEGLQILAVKCWIDFGGLPTEVALEMCVPSITREMNKNIFCICRLYSDSDSRGWLKVHTCIDLVIIGNVQHRLIDVGFDFQWIKKKKYGLNSLLQN